MPQRISKAEVFYIAIAGTILSFLIMVLSDMPSEAEIADQTMQRYCEKVRIHKEDPTLGWPDYKRIYDKECN